jgi:hypothetical protein
MFQFRDVIFQRGNDGTYLSSRGAKAMTVSVVFTSLASFFVALRMYTRIKLMRRVEANDWMVIIALVCRPLSRKVLDVNTDE